MTGQRRPRRLSSPLRHRPHRPSSRPRRAAPPAAPPIEPAAPPAAPATPPAAPPIAPAAPPALPPTAPASPPRPQCHRRPRPSQRRPQRPPSRCVPLLRPPYRLARSRQPRRPSHRSLFRRTHHRRTTRRKRKTPNIRWKAADQHARETSSPKCFLDPESSRSYTGAVPPPPGYFVGELSIAQSVTLVKEFFAVWPQVSPSG